jgi:hypothetical protein
LTKGARFAVSKTEVINLCPNTQGTFREHSGIIWTFMGLLLSEYSGNIQGAFRDVE